MEHAVRVVDTFVRSRGPSTASRMVDLGLPQLAALVAGLPSSPDRVLVAARRALPTGAPAAALAAAAAAVQDATANPKRWQACIQHADISMCFGGREFADVLLPLVAAAESGINELGSNEESGENVPDEFSGCPQMYTSVRKEKSDIVLKSVCERRDLSVSEFRDEFFKGDVAVVLRGAVSEWPAVVRWKSPKYLLKVCGHRTVPVEISHTRGSKDEDCLDVDQGSIEERFVTFRELLASMDTSSTSQGERQKMYLAQHPLFDFVPSLISDFSIPKFVHAGCTSESEVLMNVWFGSVGTGTRLHHDTADNLLAQVVGRKQVILFESSQTKYLHVPEDSQNFSPVHVDNPDFELHPNFKNASGLTCILDPGDVLFIPGGVWHWIRALSPSCSINFWF
jgi:hypothetical protein